MSFDQKKQIILDFISLYRSLPEVWNTNNINYSNRNAKVVAYEKLLTVYKKYDSKSTKDAVVKKINSLRINFRKELKKVKDSQRSGVSTEDVYVPNLWYFNELMFLVDQETPDSTRSTIEQPQEAISLDIHCLDSHNVTCTPANVIEASENDTSIIQTPKPKRSKKTDSAEEMFKIAIQELNKEDDEFLIMAKAYAAKLKKLSQEQRMYADRLIHEILFEGQLNQLTRNSTVTQTESRPTSSNSRLPYSVIIPTYQGDHDSSPSLSFNPTLFSSSSSSNLHTSAYTPNLPVSTFTTLNNVATTVTPSSGSSKMCYAINSGTVQNFIENFEDSE